MAENLVTYGADHPKTAGALEAFKKYAKSAEFTGADNQKLIFKANELINGPMKSMKLPSDADVKKSMGHIHEAIKNDASKSKDAVGALSAGNVYVAENTHRLLLKLKKDKDAEAYKKKAKEVYPYSTYFEGAKMSVV